MHEIEERAAGWEIPCEEIICEKDSRSKQVQVEAIVVSEGYLQKMSNCPNNGHLFNLNCFDVAVRYHRLIDITMNQRSSPITVSDSSSEQSSCDEARIVYEDEFSSESGDSESPPQSSLQNSDEESDEDEAIVVYEDEFSSECEDCESPSESPLLIGIKRPHGDEESDEESLSKSAKKCAHDKKEEEEDGESTDSAKENLPTTDLNEQNTQSE